MSCSRIDAGKEVGPSKTTSSITTFGNTFFPISSALSSLVSAAEEHRAEMDGDWARIGDEQSRAQMKPSSL
jgi:hypothetical protein